jgi:hypothetical protein
MLRYQIYWHLLLRISRKVDYFSFARIDKQCEGRPARSWDSGVRTGKRPGISALGAATAGRSVDILFHITSVFQRADLNATSLGNSTIRRRRAFRSA